MSIIQCPDWSELASQIKQRLRLNCLGLCCFCFFKTCRYRTVIDLSFPLNFVFPCRLRRGIAGPGCAAPRTGLRWHRRGPSRCRQSVRRAGTWMTFSYQHQARAAARCLFSTQACGRAKACALTKGTGMRWSEELQRFAKSVPRMIRGSVSQREWIPSSFCQDQGRK